MARAERVITPRWYEIQAANAFRADASQQGGASQAMGFASKQSLFRSHNPIFDQR